MLKFVEKQQKIARIVKNEKSRLTRGRKRGKITVIEYAD